MLYFEEGVKEKCVVLQYALGKVFIPVAWLMGVIPEQCETVATLIGLKTTVNEFIAYKTMGDYKKLGLLTVSF
jgi:pyrimidine nucleoside transport protein